ncbi:aconitase X [Maricaulis sp.]|uniref:cis-3-hydroxy-L-proline dehydratase n=1 Tax=Maricaulis sp. TaxID=1486257 RepID=UPI0026360AC3|nr:aconitase X [Maricaulis sp.]
MSQGAFDPQHPNTLIQAADLSGPILYCEEGLSFWGGVDAQSGTILDQHHPQCGQSIAGKVLMMPTSRGSCTGSAVLLSLALAGKAPAALVFREPEDVLSLGAIIARIMFDARIAVIRLGAEDYQKLSCETDAQLTGAHLTAGDLTFELGTLDRSGLSLSAADENMLAGGEGEAAQLAMETMCILAVLQGARTLIDVSRVHIDGCIYASEANLTFARAMQARGARVRVPTTMNAISVDLPHWRAQGVPADFGEPASALAEAYLAMGARPSFTCAPYLLSDKPRQGEVIGWSESNAVIYANSVLGARSNKHADFFDLMIAVTGRAPASGVYLDAHRQARLVLDVDLPEQADESVWPLLGWLAGQLAPDRIPLLNGLAEHHPGPDDLKAVCAAFGTTSGAPMLHMAGVTPEAGDSYDPSLPRHRIDRAALRQAWQALNQGPAKVDLVALGSPHLSASECRQFARLMDGNAVADGVSVMLTLGRAVNAEIEEDGTRAELERLGVQLVTDVCWCSISRPLFPASARHILTNSGKYAHYGPSLSGCSLRLGSLAECAVAARTSAAGLSVPEWLA